MTTQKSQIEDLQREVISQRQQLKDMQAKLEAATPKPREQSKWPGPRDYTEGFSMPASAIAAMVAAVPASVMRGIVNDAARPNPITGGPSPQPATQVRRGTGWQEPRPLEPPPGVELADRLVDAQDRIDRLELATKLAKAAAMTAGKNDDA